MSEIKEEWDIPSSTLERLAAVMAAAISVIYGFSLGFGIERSLHQEVSPIVFYDLAGVVVAIFWFWFALCLWRRKRGIRLEDEFLSFKDTFFRAGKQRWWFVDQVTDDQIQFHLYSAERTLSVSKKNIGADLSKQLESRVMRD